MERGAWTDDRLDDRFNHIDTEIAGLRADIREIRAELGARIDALGAQVQGEFQSLRSELHAEIRDLRSLTLRLYSGTLVAMAGLIAAVLARG